MNSSHYAVLNLNMKRFTPSSIPFLAVSFLALGFNLLTFTAVLPASAQNTPELFTGERRLVVANGYSTTRHWPDVLQRKLNRYYNGEQIMEVVNTYESGTPIAKWIDLDAGERDSKWKKTLQPVLESETQHPVILLAQQSLQWAFSEDRLEGIEGPEDAARIETGADAIQMYVDFAKEDGADVVFMAMHIYKWDVEPQIENEKYALEAALNRGISEFYAGPDNWTPMKDNFPLAYAKDWHHPNEIGDEIMAHFWFARMLEFDGKAVPAWSLEEMNEAIAGGGGDPGDNIPPVADLQANPISGTAPLTVTFDASGSSDADGVIVAHDWSFSDGTNDAGEIVTHTFTNNGTYTAVLTVIDDVGDADTQEIIITVSDDGGGDATFGDASGDGTVSALDASEVLQHSTGVITLTGTAAQNADVSGNGDISPYDASLILQHVVGLLNCFPADVNCSN